MDAHIIKMPDIGEGIAEVEIEQWHVNIGDRVTEDQVLADVMTDKASVEIPSPVTGVVVALGGQVGDVLAVGSTLITLQPEDTTTGAKPPVQPQPVVQADHAPSPQQPEPSPKQSDQDQSSVSPKASQQAAPEPSTPGLRNKVLASPSVRQRARHLDIDLHDLARSEGNSPVSHRDLDDYLVSRYTAGRGAHSEPSSTIESRTPLSSGHGSDTALTRGDTQIRVMGLRRQIALKMQESKRQIPHFSYIEEIDVTELERLRQSLNDEQGPDYDRLTLLPFLVRAMVLAIHRFPEVNAHFDNENAMITQFGAVHMGIATQTDNGLMVPVVHHAQAMDIWECASEIKRLTALARRGKAQRNDLTGSTITLSSLGSLGGVAATPIINHPEVAIVGVNRIVERPVVQNGHIGIRKLMNLSSSFDHRIVDGMNAARFIQEVRRLLESPVLLFVRGSP